MDYTDMVTEICQIDNFGLILASHDFHEGWNILAYWYRLNFHIFWDLLAFVLSNFTISVQLKTNTVYLTTQYIPARTSVISTHKVTHPNTRRLI